MCDDSDMCESDRIKTPRCFDVERTSLCDTSDVSTSIGNGRSILPCLCPTVPYISHARTDTTLFQISKWSKPQRGKVKFWEAVTSDGRHQVLFSLLNAKR